MIVNGGYRAKWEIHFSNLFVRQMWFVMLLTIRFFQILKFCMFKIALYHSCKLHGQLKKGMNKGFIVTYLQTRLHSSRIHTTHLLTISPSMHCTGGACSRGVPGPGECLLLGGVPGPRRCLVLGGAWSWGVPAPGEVSALEWGVVSQHALR